MSTEPRTIDRLRPDKAVPREAGAPFVSIVVPALNEEENVHVLVRRLRIALEPITESFEILLISDGSSDRTCDYARELHAEDRRVKLLHLSRPFGHQNAILAGLDHATGRVVVTMDADLQHPPEAVPELLAAWKQGADVVHAVRRSTQRSSFLVGQCKRISYAALRRLSDVDIIPQSADFRLYDRRAVRAMRRLREQSRFNRGLARWIGFNQSIVYIDEHERHGGKAKYSFVKLVRLLMDGMFSLSSKPLQYMGTLGLALSFLSGLLLVVVLTGHFLDLPRFRAITGWASTVSAILCVGGMQLTGLWLVGEYLGRTYEEVKRRPSYVVAEAVGVETDVPLEPEHGPRTIPRRTEPAPTQPRPRRAELELRTLEHV